MWGYVMYFQIIDILDISIQFINISSIFRATALRWMLPDFTDDQLTLG